MEPFLYIGYSTFPSLAEAHGAAKSLVAAKLAACVQCGSAISSFYTWEEKLEEATEYPITLKTIAAKIPSIREWFKTNHPYQVPELVFVESPEAIDSYAKWVREQLC
jgi:periplasmic divalent cation tolerance protein